MPLRRAGLHAFSGQKTPVLPSITTRVILIPAFIVFLQLSNVLDRFFRGTDVSSGQTPFAVAGCQQIECIAIFSVGQSSTTSRSGNTIADALSQSVIFDEPASAVTDITVEHQQSGRHMIEGINSLAHVMQQRCQQKLFVPRSLFSSKLKHLQTVIQHIAFGVSLPVLKNAIKRQQQRQKVMEATILRHRIVDRSGFTICRDQILQRLTNLKIRRQSLRRNVA